MRILLGALDEVHLRRGRDDVVARPGTRLREIELAVPDPRVSSDHARLVQLAHRWHVEDRGSRNGTFVNGTRVDSATLVDGDVIDAGQTIFLYREGIAQEGPAVTRPPQGPRGLRSIIPAVQDALDELARMAASPLSILIEGESGTGKEVLARAVHERSGRPGAFVAVNCGGLPRERVAAELFGWRKGSFPGAIADHLGLVRAAHGGTLFLDEIGDFPLLDQTALLRVLQQKEVLPIGATQPVAVDLRVVAATHRPVDALVATGAFREDLLGRLAGYRAWVPPLRERRADLGLLLAELLAGEPAKAVDVTIHIQALRALMAGAWRNNVRELEQAIAQALVRRPAGGPIDVEHLPPARAVAGPSEADDGEEVPVDGADVRRRGELIALLERHAGNVTAVAQAMGKARMQVQRWLKRYRLDPARFRR